MGASPLAALVLFGFVLGFGVKLPIVPLHSWLPDAHTDAPTAGSVMLAGVLLKMGGYGFIRIALPAVPDAFARFAVPLAIIAVIALVYGAAVAMGGWPRGVGIVLRADPLTAAFALVTTAMLLAAVGHEAASGVNSHSFPALMAFLMAGLNGLFLTGDVFNFYVFFEVLMASAVVLAAYPGEGRQLRAAYTFAVVNLLRSVFYLGGTAARYQVTGTLDMREAARHLVLLALGMMTLAAWG